MISPLVLFGARATWSGDGADPSGRRRRIGVTAAEQDDEGLEGHKSSQRAGRHKMEKKRSRAGLIGESMDQRGVAKCNSTG